jgi:hypothetical protein
MAKGVNKLLAVALAGAGLYGAWTVGKSLLSSDTDAESTRYVVNQIWIERMPQSQRELVGHLVVVDHPQGHFGAAGRSSQWRHMIEGFVWKLEGQRLNVYFPQDEVHAAVQVRTYNCEDEAPAPFELCLELTNGGRSVTYYSRKDWKIEPHDADQIAELAEETPQLRGILDSIVAPTTEVEELDLESFRDVQRLPIAD